MQALMLAAGMGKRLGRFTKNSTKCMVNVNGKTLIEYAIEALVKCGIQKFIIVVGYKSEILKNYIKEKFPKEKLNGMEIEFIENTIFDKTNNIYSLYLARKELEKDDTILLESDLIFKGKIIQQMISSPEKNLAAVSHYENWMDGTCTLLDENDSITGMVSKENFSWQKTDLYYKTVNIYKFSSDFSKKYYIPFLEAYQKTFGMNEYYEQVLRIISYLQPNILKGFKVSSDDWYEIDDAADLAIAENKFATTKEKLKLFEKRFGGFWRFPKLKDYCYLVNPYFPPESMVEEMKSNFSILLDQYPSGAYQNSILAGKIFNIAPENIVVGNGAAELISSAMQKISGKIVIPYPTFNEYPERLPNAEIVELKTDFSYTAADVFQKAKDVKASTVLLINPDNPSGNFLKKDEVLSLCRNLKEINCNLVFDESFIDFSEKEIRYTLLDENILFENPNLTVIKSLSKSYGVPSLRLGVLANSDSDYVQKIKKANAIWNINSFAEYFMQIFTKYSKYYETACDKIARERKRFSEELSKIAGIKVYKSQANFLLCELQGKISATNLTQKLLDEYNIFIKDLSHKKCFENGKFIRLAVKSEQDDNEFLEVLRKIKFFEQ